MFHTEPKRWNRRVNPATLLEVDEAGVLYLDGVVLGQAREDWALTVPGWEPNELMHSRTHRVIKNGG